MEKKLTILIFISAVQTLGLLWLCLQSFPSVPSVAYAGDAQQVTLVEHRLSRYAPLPVVIRNDDPVRVHCVQ
jgi:hypothetical protein